MRQTWRTPKKPGETGHCWECGVKLTGRRRHFCCDEHGNDWWGRHDWRRVRIVVMKRDDWTCQECGYRNRRGQFRDQPTGEKSLEVDHIVPVSEGGDNFNKSNLRTLCVDCHKDITKQWHGERATDRRQQKYVQPWPLKETRCKGGE